MIVSKLCGIALWAMVEAVSVDAGETQYLLVAGNAPEQKCGDEDNVSGHVEISYNTTKPLGITEGRGVWMKVWGECHKMWRYEGVGEIQVESIAWVCTADRLERDQ